MRTCELVPGAMLSVTDRPRSPEIARDRARCRRVDIQGSSAGESELSRRPPRHLTEGQNQREWANRSQGASALVPLTTHERVTSDVSRARESVSVSSHRAGLETAPFCVSLPRRTTKYQGDMNSTHIYVTPHR